MKKITYSELLQACYSMRDDGELSLPYEGVPKVENHGANPELSEADWNALSWNPPAGLGYDVPDETASPKPAWSAICARVRAARLIEKIRQQSIEDVTSQRKALTDRQIEVAGRPVHVGGGLSHMTGLIHLVGAASAAGRALPKVVLREEPEDWRSAEAINPHTIWTYDGLMQFLIDLGERENAVEAAHNAMIGTYHKLRRVRNDSSKSIAAREKAVADIDQWKVDYLAAIKTAAKGAATRDLPADLAALQAVLCERTEAAATGHQKHLKGALTQQAIDNWAQCTGIDDALRDVSKQCAIACIAIQRATDAAAAQAAYDAGVKAIEAVTAVHTPVWVVDGVDYGAAQAAPIALAGSAATVTAKHPADQDIDGQVVLTSAASAPVSVVAVQTTDAKAHSCKFTVKTPVSGETVKLFLTARSLCGPSELEVHLTP